jgi:GTPase
LKALVFKPILPLQERFFSRFEGANIQPLKLKAKQYLIIYFCLTHNLQLVKAGFVNIFGKPNAGKSTLLNALVGEKLAIVSHKVQTTRHRIKGIVTTDDYQIIFSDTPGIIEPKYKLHEKMMQAVKGSLEDADVALLLVDIKDDWNENDQVFSSLNLKVPSLVIINKIDKAKPEKIEEAINFFSSKSYCKKALTISALTSVNLKKLMDEIISLLPESEPFYAEDELTDLSEKFLVGEIIREKIFNLIADEIPYHTTVLVHEFKQKSSLLKIGANIIVQRETQKGIILGENGSMIKKIGSEARKEIEQFVNQKVFLELFVKVRPNWRENELYLKEYGY